MIYSLESGVHGRTFRYRRGKRPLRIVSSYAAKGGLVVGLFVVGVVAYGTGQAARPAPIIVASQSSSVPDVAPPARLALPIKTVRFDAVAIQTSLDTWSKTRPNASVVVATADGKVLGSTKADTPYFMASIYKLYVAYFGYQSIDEGVWNPTEPYLRGLSRQQCLDEMVRNSDSPCAEKILAELGKANVQTRLTALGLTQTSIAGLTTTAGDAAIMLQKIQTGEGLSQASQAKFLTSMEQQKYRNALPKGFTGLTVYNKVGFNNLAEYHDVSIVRLADGMPIIVAVMTKNTGNRSIASLATQLLQVTQPK